eukprot:1180057-Prorocentrum_minimum.AAC.2
MAFRIPYDIICALYVSRTSTAEEIENACGVRRSTPAMQYQCRSRPMRLNILKIADVRCSVAAGAHLSYLWLRAPHPADCHAAGICPLPSLDWFASRRGLQVCAFQQPPMGGALRVHGAQRHHQLPPGHLRGRHQGAHMPPPLARLVRAAGICPLPSLDWFASRVYALCVSLIGGSRQVGAFVRGVTRTSRPGCVVAVEVHNGENFAADLACTCSRPGVYVHVQVLSQGNTPSTMEVTMEV